MVALSEETFVTLTQDIEIIKENIEKSNYRKNLKLL